MTHTAARTSCWPLVSVITLTAIAVMPCAGQCPSGEFLDIDGTQERYSVAVAGDTVFAGAHWVPVGDSAVGVVRQHSFVGDGWVEDGLILPPDLESARAFGWEVVPDPGTGFLLVSDPVEDGGVVWVLERQASVWRARDFIRPMDQSYFDRFGYSMAIEGDYLMVGAPGEASSYGRTGVVRFYQRDGDGWVLDSVHRSVVGDTIDNLGFSVHLSGARAVAGGSRGAAAYTYFRPAEDWVPRGTLVPPDSAASSAFGRATQILGDSVFVSDVGAPFGDRVYVYAASLGGRREPRDSLRSWVDRPGLFGAGLAQRDGRLVVFDPVSGRYNSGSVLVFEQTASYRWTPEWAYERDAIDEAIDVAVSGQWLAFTAMEGRDQTRVEVLSLRRRCLCPADFNEDYAINSADVVAFLSAWADRLTSADVNHDGVVNTADVVWFLHNWSQTTSC